MPLLGLLSILSAAFLPATFPASSFVCRDSHVILVPPENPVFPTMAVACDGDVVPHGPRPPRAQPNLARAAGRIRIETEADSAGWIGKVLDADELCFPLPPVSQWELYLLRGGRGSQAILCKPDWNMDRDPLMDIVEPAWIFLGVSGEDLHRSIGKQLLLRLDRLEIAWKSPANHGPSFKRTAPPGWFKVFESQFDNGFGLDNVR
ncbi:uncharacterized protein VTP21DRAFT_1454 [Calcarisporiella thermophila]|uniref:uncharacterized protein n=1 Tax=Calcarisporiella thermophila TaxID=911321 RepID=UPI00374479BD